ncbi:hypothetical protein A2229_03775 [Candidatus Peregrinibacteria bacterium RIFOXYA2_FULL_33_7]|nr:MAG: hypothetical protein A2229_03775 [Candidatus Peregrinibacteria bacterium RIFOXYA2_FULL_33_7]
MLQIFLTFISFLILITFGNFPILIFNFGPLFFINLIISVISVILILIIWRCYNCRKTFIFRICPFFSKKEICPNCQAVLYKRKRFDLINIFSAVIILLILLANGISIYMSHYGHRIKIPIYYKINEFHGTDSWSLDAVKFNKQISISISEGMVLSSIFEKMNFVGLEKNLSLKKEIINLENGGKAIFYFENDSGEVWLKKDDISDPTKIFSVDFVNSEANLEEIREIIKTI